MTQAPTSHVRTVTLGVVVEKELLDHPWQDHRWRVAAVMLSPPPAPHDWVALAPSAQDRSEAPRYHAGNFDVELHRKETGAYKLNLEDGAPSVYVVLTDGASSGGAVPVAVQLVTVSPDEAQAYGGSGFETVERVAMPAGLVPLIAAFIEQHHVEEAFVKRKRSKVKTEDELFGQEPIIVRRRRGIVDDGAGGGS